MTYGEIYTEIINHCFPGVVPPVNMPAIIRSKIKSAHRMINRDYNFWFTLGVSTIATVASQRSYALPDNFKDIERVYFTIYLQSYNGYPLEQLNLTDHLDYGLQTSVSSTEYPDKFRIDGANIDLYPLPSEVRTLNVLYWRFLPVLVIDPANLDTTFTNFTDDISEYCDEAIIYYVSHVVKLMQDEWQSASLYKELYAEALQGAMQEDKTRRAIPENRVE